jgi:hypothetical protein
MLHIHMKALTEHRRLIRFMQRKAALIMKRRQWSSTLLAGWTLQSRF